MIEHYSRSSDVLFYSECKGQKSKTGVISKRCPLHAPLWLRMLVYDISQLQTSFYLPHKMSSQTISNKQLFRITVQDTMNSRLAT